MKSEAEFSDEIGARYYSFWIHLAVQPPSIKSRFELAAGHFNIFLEKNSPHLKSHSNWRNKSLKKIGLRQEDNLHHSSAFTLSSSAALQIKQNILNLIELNIAPIREAKDEEVYVFAVDFLKFKNQVQLLSWW